MSDPVDAQMITTIKELASVAPIHVIVSGDKDMLPVMNHLRDQRKEVHQVFVNQGRRAVLVKSDNGTFEIPWPEKTSSRMYSGLARTV